MQFYDRTIIEQNLPIDVCLQLSKIAFELHSQGKVVQPLRSIVAAADGRLMGTMPACISDGEYAGFGLKSVLVDFNRSVKGRSHEGCILIYDAPTAGCIAAVDAGAITELRTAAASAWATHLLAPSNATRLAILGTGTQAKRHVLAMLAVRSIQQIVLWGRNEANVAAFADWCRQHTLQSVKIATTPAQAVADADIICTLTAAHTPFLSLTDLPARCHINAVGASAHGFQELTADIYPAVALFVDSHAAMLAASQCFVQAQEQGFITQDYLVTEIGTLDTLQIQHVHSHSGGKTLFKSVGLAVQDLVFAREVVKQQNLKAGAAVFSNSSHSF